MNLFPHRMLAAARLSCIAAAALALNVQAENVLVSRSSEGEQAGDYSTFPSISDDGRYVAFISGADNLVPGDSNGEPDTFVHDRETRETTRVSVANDGSQADEGVGWTTQSISGDGRYVVFSSASEQLVSGDDNEAHDIFVHDRETGETSRVSVASDGSQANGFSMSAGIFGNGRYVTFESGADNLVEGDTNGITDVFLHDRETGLTRRVNLASDGSEAKELQPRVSWSWIWWYSNPVSDDGRYVAFTSWSGNLAPGDDNALEDVFVHDLETGETERVSLDVDGRQFENYSSLLLDLSGDGRFVAFQTLYRADAPDWEPGSLCIHDRETEKTRKIPGGFPAVFSSDGRYLAYIGTENPLRHDLPAGVRVLDMQTNETLDSVVSFRGNPADDSIWNVTLSGDGKSVAFNSNATNLVPGDKNSTSDVFVTDNPHFFRINAGLNDAWYDPQTPGQGFQVTVLPLQKKIFVSWMTYDTDIHGQSASSPLGGHGQRWLTAFGPYEGRKAVLEVSSNMGGLFDSGEPAPNSYSYGPMTLEFTRCTNGTVSYDFPSIDRRRVIPMQRAALDNVPLCELLNEIED
jgi:Tol biopolymer transport system component